MKEIVFDNSNYIKSYQFYAFPLGVLSAYNDTYRKWMLGRFIRVSFGEVLQYDEAAYDDWEVIDQTLYRELSTDYFKEIIRSLIDDNQAFHLWGINERYLPHTSAYQTFDYIHDLLITGYDDSNNLIVIKYNENDLLSRDLININDIINCFTNQTQGRSFKILEDKVIVTSSEQILDDIKQYTFPDNMYQLKYYNKELNPKNEIITGIPAIKMFLESLKQDFNRSSHLNGICLLNEHKKSIMNTLLYLNESNTISEEICKRYIEIVKISEIIKVKYLKYLVTSNKNLIEQITLAINNMIINEVTILSTLL